MLEVLIDKQHSQPASSGRGYSRGFRSRCVRSRIANGLRAFLAVSGVWSPAWGRGAVLRPPPLPATSPASLLFLSALPAIPLPSTGPSAALSLAPSSARAPSLPSPLLPSAPAGPLRLSHVSARQAEGDLQI